MSWLTTLAFLDGLSCRGHIDTDRSISPQNLLLAGPRGSRRMIALLCNRTALTACQSLNIAFDERCGVALARSGVYEYCTSTC